MAEKFLLDVSYSGTDFFGWQCQPNNISVQQVLEEKLSYLFNTKIRVRSAGRTDAGVHGIGMPAAFISPEKPEIGAEKLKVALNKILPKTVYIRSITERNADFDARFDAEGKAYTYVLSSINPGPFISNYCWKVPFEFSSEKLIASSRHIIGEKDFSSFAVSLNKTKKNPIREIYRVDIDNFNGYTCVTFFGKSFLYKMVRSLISSLVYCSSTAGDPEDMKRILQEKNRASAFKTAPPQGLFLMKVFYKKGEWNNYKLNRLPFLY